MDNQQKCRSITDITLTSTACNLILSLLKFILGTIGHSQAVIADAVHSLSDLSTDLAILVGVRFWSKPPDEDHPHGHHKIETIVSFFIGIVLALIAIKILIQAIISIHTRSITPPCWPALLAAIISILVKETLYRWTLKKGKVIRSEAIIANASHQRSDVISSIATAIAVLIAMIYPDWSFVDYIGAIIVSLLIFQASFKIITPSLGKLADRGIPAMELTKIYHIAQSIDGVRGVHDVRTRYIGSDNIAVDLHIEVDANLSVKAAHAIYQAVKNKLLSCPLSIIDIIVHIDPHGEDKPSNHK